MPWIGSKGSVPQMVESSSRTRSFLLAEHSFSIREWFLAMGGSSLYWKSSTVCGMGPLNPTHWVKEESEKTISARSGNATPQFDLFHFTYPQPFAPVGTWSSLHSSPSLHFLFPTILWSGLGWEYGTSSKPPSKFPHQCGFDPEPSRA